MPLYEYRCRTCRRRFTRLFRSVATVGDPGPCPSCGSTAVERLLSRVVVRRAGERIPEDVGGPEWSNDLMEEEAFPEEGEFFPDIPDTEDPRELARWTREMAAAAGEPLDPAFDRALHDLERGEDPDRVLDRLEEESAEREPPPENAVSEMD